MTNCRGQNLPLNLHFESLVFLNTFDSDIPKSALMTAAIKLHSWHGWDAVHQDDDLNMIDQTGRTTGLGEFQLNGRGEQLTQVRNGWAERDVLEKLKLELIWVSTNIWEQKYVCVVTFGRVYVVRQNLGSQSTLTFARFSPTPNAVTAECMKIRRKKTASEVLC